MTKKLIAKQWLDATIQNNFFFGKTMELYPDTCLRLLELILNTTIKEINYPEHEKTIKIRLEVYVDEKGSNRSFDVEMQIANSDNIDKRMRYYQGLVDTDKLKREQHYSKLGISSLSSSAPSSDLSTDFTSILSLSVVSKITVSPKFS